MNKDQLLQYLMDLNKYLKWLAYESEQLGIDTIRIDIENIHYTLNKRIQPKLDEYFRTQKNEK